MQKTALSSVVSPTLSQFILKIPIGSNSSSQESLVDTALGEDPSNEIVLVSILDYSMLQEVVLTYPESPCVIIACRVIRLLGVTASSASSTR